MLLQGAPVAQLVENATHVCRGCPGMLTDTLIFVVLWFAFYAEKLSLTGQRGLNLHHFNYAFL